MLNHPLRLRMWKENQSITLFRSYFRINKGHIHILLVDDGKNDDSHGSYRRYIKGYSTISFMEGSLSPPIKDNFHIL